MTRIAFLGLGNMGCPMAANLVKAGHEVFGYDPQAGAGAAAKKVGVNVVSDAIASLRDAEIVITMLPAGKFVVDAYTGASGLLTAARPGTLFVDCSTIDVAAARLVAQAARKQGFSALDAPVSGGVVGATAATLTFMVGGERDAYESARPILGAMGKKVVHCGGSGAGQAAKVCNNMILGVSMIAVAEAFALADKLGLDRQALFDVASTSSGQCWALTTYCPVPGPVPASPANHDYKPGFSAALMSKDLKLSQEAAQEGGVATPLGASASQIYTLMQTHGYGDRDFSAVFEFLSRSRNV